MSRLFICTLIGICIAGLALHRLQNTELDCNEVTRGVFQYCENGIPQKQLDARALGEKLREHDLELPSGYWLTKLGRDGHAVITEQTRSSKYSVKRISKRFGITYGYEKSGWHVVVFDTYNTEINYGNVIVITLIILFCGIMSTLALLCWAWKRKLEALRKNRREMF